MRAAVSKIICSGTRSPRLSAQREASLLKSYTIQVLQHPVRMMVESLVPFPGRPFCGPVLRNLRILTGDWRHASVGGAYRLNIA